MTVSVDVDASEILALARRFREAVPTITSLGRRTMQESLDVLRQAIVTRTPVNTGALRASVMTDVRGQGLDDLIGVVSTPLIYGLPVEHGRRPGKMPPVDAIRYWVIRKQIADEEGAESAAWMIARAIGRRGTKGAHMFEEGLKASRGAISRLWGNTTRLIVRAMGR